MAIAIPRDDIRDLNNVIKIVTTEYGEGGGGGLSVDVDEQLSADSTNPVLNKAIYAAVNAKVNKTNKQVDFKDYTLGQYLSVLTDDLGGAIVS